MSIISSATVVVTACNNQRSNVRRRLQHSLHSILKRQRHNIVSSFLQELILNLTSIFYCTTFFYCTHHIHRHRATSMPPVKGPIQTTLDDFELGEEVAWGSLATVSLCLFSNSRFRAYLNAKMTLPDYRRCL